ncbi:MAG TPA: hypothetical protein PK191_04795 [Niabella sp.]|nr:hypothetical protein [Niabella sp.]HOZ95881.1 hypothetical protein [Niabella sp.]HQW15793.1 hypothetical protein [Niabella sp.]HQX20933.1 hypothetical protein [Niabella sp.]HQX41423.1 hypothetical protein [Niabella sp.]
MVNINWRRFSLRISINTTTEKLYWCWATREGMEYWFLRNCAYKKPEGIIRAKDEQVCKGDSYVWHWHGWPDDVKEEGALFDSNGRDYFKFSFGKAGICSVRFFEEHNHQMIELIQEEIPEDEKGKITFHVGCKTGWTFYLANLKSLLEGGIDLRNKDELLKDVINS